MNQRKNANTARRLGTPAPNTWAAGGGRDLTVNACPAPIITGPEPTERCESIHPEQSDLRCNLSRGHDAHRNGGDAWTIIGRLEGHVLVSAADLAKALDYGDDCGDDLLTEALDRLSAALKTATEQP